MREELGYVLECDLDLMLMLDARTGGPLARYLAKRAGVSLGEITAARSTLRCAGSRETDVEISWPGGALLVEDKIDAAFTPGQPESYRTEVDARRAAGEDVASVLVCPRRRRALYELEAGDSFTCVVDIEDLVKVAEDDGDRFSLAARMVLLAAAEPRPTRPTTPVDLARSDWGDGYRRVVGSLLTPDDRLPLGPGSLRTATADWMYFPVAGIDPEGVWSFGHWIPGGEVRMDLMVEDEPAGLPRGAVSVAKPSMWWVNVKVTPVTFVRSAEEQRDAIAEAVAAALALRRWVAAAGLRPKSRTT